MRAHKTREEWAQVDQARLTRRPNARPVDRRYRHSKQVREKLAEVIDLEAVRRRRLVRRSFAHGLLKSYELVDGEDVGEDGGRRAA